MNNAHVHTQFDTDNLDRIGRKAQMLADMHGYLADFNQRWHHILKYGTLMVSVLLLTLTFAPDTLIIRATRLSDDYLQLAKALVAAANFFAGLLLTQWNPAEQEAKHREAIRHYTNALYSIRELKERGEWSQDEVRLIQSRYLDDRTIPRIPSRYFLRLKQRYLRQVAISKYLDEHPFAFIPWVRVRFWLEERKLEASATASDRVDMDAIP